MDRISQWLINRSIDVAKNKEAAKQNTLESYQNMRKGRRNR